MDNISFDWHNDFNCGTPEFPSYSGGPRAELSVSPAAERADQPSGDGTLPLLRLGSWESSKQYDKNNPECIHYDFRWKVSQRENIRARHVYSDTDPDLVLAPSDFWKVKFQSRLESLLKDKDRFPGENYTCEETIIEISIERSRQRGMTKRCQKTEIDWNAVDSHLEGLSDLFRKGRKITFNMEFIYKEGTRDSTRARGGKKKSATDAQKLQRAAEAGLWTRVYKHYRCRAKYCKQGPHCCSDERGNHHKLQPRHLEAILDYIKSNMQEGETEEEVDVNIEIPPNIFKGVLDDSRKRKAESSVDYRHCRAHACGQCNAAESTPKGVEGDRKDKLEEYCNWTLKQVKNDEWREELQAAIQFASSQFLELNSILQHPNVTMNLMVKGGVKLGIAMQFVSNIKNFQKEANDP